MCISLVNLSFWVGDGWAINTKQFSKSKETGNTQDSHFILLKGFTVTGMGGSSLAVESSTREGFDSMRNDLDEAATVKGEMGRRRRPARRAFLPTRWSPVVGTDKRAIRRFFGDLPRFRSRGLCIRADMDWHVNIDLREPRRSRS